jgi:hypothetical protein
MELEHLPEDECEPVKVHLNDLHVLAMEKYPLHCDRRMRRLTGGGIWGLLPTVGFPRSTLLNGMAYVTPVPWIEYPITTTPTNTKASSSSKGGIINPQCENVMTLTHAATTHYINNDDNRHQVVVDSDWWVGLIFHRERTLMVHPHSMRFAWRNTIGKYLIVSDSNNNNRSGCSTIVGGPTCGRFKVKRETIDWQSVSVGPDHIVWLHEHTWIRLIDSDTTEHFNIHTHGCTPDDYDVALSVTRSPLVFGSWSRRLTLLPTGHVCTPVVVIAKTECHHRRQPKDEDDTRDVNIRSPSIHLTQNTISEEEKEEETLSDQSPPLVCDILSLLGGLTDREHTQLLIHAVLPRRLVGVGPWKQAITTAVGTDAHLSEYPYFQEDDEEGIPEKKDNDDMVALIGFRYPGFQCPVGCPIDQCLPIGMRYNDSITMNSRLEEPEVDDDEEYEDHDRGGISQDITDPSPVHFQHIPSSISLTSHTLPLAHRVHTACGVTLWLSELVILSSGTPCRDRRRRQRSWRSSSPSHPIQPCWIHMDTGVRAIPYVCGVNFSAIDVPSLRMAIDRGVIKAVMEQFLVWLEKCNPSSSSVNHLFFIPDTRCLEGIVWPSTIQVMKLSDIDEVYIQEKYHHIIIGVIPGLEYNKIFMRFMSAFLCKNILHPNHTPMFAVTLILSAIRQINGQVFFCDPFAIDRIRESIHCRLSAELYTPLEAAVSLLCDAPFSMIRLLTEMRQHPRFDSGGTVPRFNAGHLYIALHEMWRVFVSDSSSSEIYSWGTDWNAVATWTGWSSSFIGPLEKSKYAKNSAGDTEDVNAIHLRLGHLCQIGEQNKLVVFRQYPYHSMHKRANPLDSRPVKRRRKLTKIRQRHWKKTELRFRHRRKDVMPLMSSSFRNRMGAHAIMQRLAGIHIQEDHMHFV